MKTRVFSDNFNLLCQGTTSEAQLFEVVSDRTTSLAPRTIFESHLPEKVSAKIALNFHIFFPQKHLTLYSKPQLKKKNLSSNNMSRISLSPKKKATAWSPRGSESTRVFSGCRHDRRWRSKFQVKMGYSRI